jgi:hypothetical protein
MKLSSWSIMTRKNSIKYKERQAILRRARFSDQEIIMEKDKTYVKNILDSEFSEDDQLVIIQWMDSCIPKEEEEFHTKTCVNISHLSLELPHVNNSRQNCLKKNIKYP